MIPFKLFLIIFVVKCMDIVMSFNPLLTYTVRYHKIRFHPNISGDCTINQYNNKEFVNGNITISSTKSIDKVVAVFNRCNPEGINCEYFQSWTLTDLCPKMKDPNQLWSSVYSNFHPPLTCPINKTNYEIKNASVDVNQAIRLYSEAVNYQWKVTQTFYAGDIQIGSYTVDASIFGYRKRSAKSSRH